MSFDARAVHFVGGCGYGFRALAFGQPRNDGEAIMSSLQNFSGTLVLVGAGKMGGAMLEGWLALGLDPHKIAILEPKPAPEISALAARGVRINPASVDDASVIVIAVKPQVAPEVVPNLKTLLRPGTVAVSVMAGKTVGFLESALGDCAIVRSIPNTPAAVGRGITVAVPNAKVSEAQRKLSDALLRSVGAVEWVEDEGLIDAATAVSGSGPAYVFLLAESLARAGTAAGLPPDLAARLARATVSGSGELLHRSALDAATLRANVTSPGGTTAAALGVLMAGDGLDPLMEKAVAAATKRSRELAG
jgi:pyrroline-5-carboxylate reductase